MGLRGVFGGLLVLLLCFLFFVFFVFVWNYVCFYWGFCFWFGNWFFILWFCELFFIDNFLINISFSCDGIYLLILFCINITFCFVIFYAMYYLFFDSLLIRFIIILTMFVLFMNMFLLALDFLTAYIAWEFIGLFSFFLISYFWFRYYALKCGFKAFFIGKMGDIALFIAFIYLYKHFNFLIFTFIYVNYNYDYYFISTFILFTCLCSFTKSTQFGLHIWLPDAMEGPIPVSALIHAATLVVCGILLTSFIIQCLDFWISTLYILFFWSAGLLLLLAASTLSNFDVKRGF